VLYCWALKADSRTCYHRNTPDMSASTTAALVVGTVFSLLCICTIDVVSTFQD
jgi:hypothetical protein